MGTRESVQAIIVKKPGLSAPEIAHTLFGPKGVQQRVNPALLGLFREGRLERRGYGGPGDPYRYYPKA